MNARYKHLLGNKGLDVQAGQFWIRRVDVSKINNPLNIEVIAMPDEQDERFYVREVARNVYFFFFREDIVNNYEVKVYVGSMDINEQIYEILGGRKFIDKDGNRLYNKFKKENSIQDPNGIPDYCNTPKLADMLLHSLEKFNPKVKVRMGKYTVYLDKPYSGISREEAICKAWIDKNA